MIPMKKSTWLPAILMLFALGSVGIVACDSQGPAEETGEEIDEAAEETGEAWEETKEEMNDEE